MTNVSKTRGSGSMRSVARVLSATVPVGGLFDFATLAKIADASERTVERRIRDIKNLDGWVIHSIADDATVPAFSRRLVSVGVHIWEPDVAAALHGTMPSSYVKASDVNLDGLTSTELTRFAELVQGESGDTVGDLYRKYLKLRPGAQNRIQAELFRRLGGKTE